MSTAHTICFERRGDYWIARCTCHPAAVGSGKTKAAAKLHLDAEIERKWK